MSEQTCVIESTASIDKVFSPGALMVSGTEKKAVVKVRVGEDGKAELLLEHNGLVSSHELFPGDECTFSHTIRVDHTRGIKADHIFPLALDYNGETYMLRRTKKNKLILTK